MPGLTTISSRPFGEVFRKKRDRGRKPRVSFMERGGDGAVIVHETQQGPEWWTVDTLKQILLEAAGKKKGTRVLLKFNTDEDDCVGRFADLVAQLGAEGFLSRISGCYCDRINGSGAHIDLYSRG